MAEENEAPEILTAVAEEQGSQKFYLDVGGTMILQQPTEDVPGVALILMSTGEVRWAQVTNSEAQEG